MVFEILPVVDFACDACGKKSNNIIFENAILHPRSSLYFCFECFLSRLVDHIQVFLQVVDNYDLVQLFNVTVEAMNRLCE